MNRPADDGIKVTKNTRRRFNPLKYWQVGLNRKTKKYIGNIIKVNFFNYIFIWHRGLEGGKEDLRSPRDK